MKKRLLLLLLVGLTLVLFSCSGPKSGVPTKGVIDSKTIEISNLGVSGRTYSYSTSYSRVYEYKSESGDTIYANTYSKYYDYDLGDNAYGSIRLYQDNHTSEYIDYHYNGFIGWIIVENNYYLDLSKRTIDCETKYSEYKYKTNPEDSSVEVTEVTPDNKKAYSCAKKSYYILGSLNSSNYVWNVRKNLTETGTERHTYVILGSDCTITYQEK